MKRSSLQERVSKFTPNKIYEIAPYPGEVTFWTGGGGGAPLLEGLGH
jgi:hypothetical protein